MISTTNQIPASMPGDSSDVEEALEIARTLWNKGNRRDALRWVRRAAGAADEAGLTGRVLTLASAAADLESVAPVPPALPSRARSASPERDERATVRTPRSERTAPPPSIPPAPRMPSGVKAVAPPPPEKRVRVSVRTSVRDPGLLVVRPIAEEDALPPGTREAYLVFSEFSESDVRAATSNGSVA